jgi:hypothetical protein
MCLLLKPSLSRFSFLLVDLGKVGRDLLVVEEFKCDSSPVAVEGCDAGMFFAGEDMPLSQLVALIAVG